MLLPEPDRRSFPFFLSLAVQCSLVLMLAIPWTVQTLTNRGLFQLPVIIDLRSLKPADPTVRAHSQPSSSNALRTPSAAARMFRAPQTVPSSTNASALPDAPEISFDARAPIGIGGSGGEGTRLTDVTRSVTKPNVVPETAEKNEAAERAIVVGGKVQAAKLIHQVQPVYPVLARQTRAQGVVTLDAVIGADGSIQQLHLVSGHPLLTASAMQAVQQWRYSPTFLNGKAVEVHTTIEVRFTLSGL